MPTELSSWIRLPAARRGAKCPVSGWSRRHLQSLIYGVPSKGIPAKGIKYRVVPGGKGNNGTVFIHVPSLQAYMLGESEVPDQHIDSVRILAQSPQWCQGAITSLLTLCRDRAGLTAAEFIDHISHNHHEPA